MAAAAVSSQSHLVFCPPRLGKPPESGGHTWVVLKGSRANTCWDAAFDLIRTPADSIDKEKRRLEGRALARRRAVEEHERSLPLICHELSNNQTKDCYSTYTKESCKWLLTEGVIKTVCPHDIVRAFQKQNAHKNLYEYLLHLKFYKRDKINRDYLSEFNRDPVNLYRDSFQLDWANLDKFQQSAFLDVFARFITARNYGFKPSKWCPGAPIEQLILILKDEGAIFIGGFFNFRDARVVKLKKVVQYRQIWEKIETQQNGLGAYIGHCRVIVGAEIGESDGVVYYIDPCDDSDPAHPKKQRIYEISYKTLTALNVIDGKFGRIVDAYGRACKIYSPATRYGFYYPKDKRERDFHALFVALDTLRAQVGSMLD